MGEVNNTCITNIMPTGGPNKMPSISKYGLAVIKLWFFTAAQIILRVWKNTSFPILKKETKPKLLITTVGGLSSLAAVRQLLPDH